MSCMVASATATTFGLSRGLLGLHNDQINASESESESDTNLNRHLTRVLKQCRKGRLNVFNGLNMLIVCV